MPAFKKTAAVKQNAANKANSGATGKKTADIPEKVESRTVPYKNKKRVLVLGSRGITARFRHLLEDFKKLIPHHKKDNKLDAKSDIKVVNEIAEMKSCNHLLYLECRKRRDLYMYIGGTPDGPSMKFQVVNIHTMDELKLTGNCMLGSRPVLNFDARFDGALHWQIAKKLLTSTFGTPRGHPKSKPFVDRIMSFFIVNGNIWARNFQIVHKADGSHVATSSSSAAKAGVHLVEIGPRFVLKPIRTFSGSLGGATLYQNATYETPSAERSNSRKEFGNAYLEKKQRQEKKKRLDAEYMPEPDPLAGTKMFQ